MSSILFTREYLIRRRHKHFKFNTIIKQECLGENQQENGIVGKFVSQFARGNFFTGKSFCSFDIPIKKTWNSIFSSTRCVTKNILAAGMKTCGMLTCHAFSVSVFFEDVK